MSMKSTGDNIKLWEKSDVFEVLPKTDTPKPVIDRMQLYGHGLLAQANKMLNEESKSTVLLMRNEQYNVVVPQIGALVFKNQVLHDFNLYHHSEAK
jgi:hypothetical protein